MLLNETPIAGHCDDRFAGVRAAFTANFVERGDVGAAVAVRLGGEPMVDLVGGWADGGRQHQWLADTVVNVWSSTKGVAAACFAMLVDAGRICYDDRVADHWPEFAARGKAKVTIAELLSHQAGLCGFVSPATVDDLLAGSVSAALLASQAPFWKLGGGSGYHAITGGILATELFERIEGRSLRRFVADELRAQRGLDISIGLDPSSEHLRAEMLAPPAMDSAQIGSLTPVQLAALANPPLEPLLPNVPAWRRADLPSANGHANARSLAGLYALLLDADGGLIGRDTLAEATAVRVEGVDLVLGVPARWGAGFLRNSDGIYGPNEAAFGHSGWGGSFAFGDPTTGLAVSYTMNRMGTQLRDDPRDTALIDAIYAAMR